MSHGEFSSPNGTKYFGKWEGDSLLEGVYVSPLGDRFTGKFDNLGEYLTGSLQTLIKNFIMGHLGKADFMAPASWRIWTDQFTLVCSRWAKNGTGILEDNDGTVYHGKFKLGLPMAGCAV